MEDESFINIDGSKDAVANLGVAVSNFKYPEIEKNNGYIALKDLELDNGFISSYTESLKDLVDAVNQIKDHLSGIIENMEQNDLNVEREMPVYDNNIGSESTDDTDHIVDSSSDSAGIFGSELADNSAEQFQRYKDLSVLNLSALLDELNDAAASEGVTIEELLSNEEYSDKIKESILSSPNITDELRQLIEESSSAVSQKVIRDILNGDQVDIIGLDNNTLQTLKIMLESMTEDNSLTLDEILSNEENIGLIKEALSNMGTASELLKNLNEEDFETMVTKIYDGDSIEDIDLATVNTIRNYVDVISTNNNIPVEDVFKSDNLIDEIKQLSKFSLFTENLSGYSDASICSILKNLFMNS